MNKKNIILLLWIVVGFGLGYSVYHHDQSSNNKQLSSDPQSSSTPSASSSPVSPEQALLRDVPPEMLVANRPLDALDKKLFTNLTQIYHTYQHYPDKLWTSSYRLDKESAIFAKSVHFADKDKTIESYYLINLSHKIDLTDPKKYHQVIFADNPYLKDVFWAKKTDVPALFLDYPIAFTAEPAGSGEALLFRYYEKLLDGVKHNRAMKFRYFYPHEAFHTFVQKKWTYDAEAQDVFLPGDYPYDAKQLALKRQEYAYLDQAMALLKTNGLSDQLRLRTDLIPIMQQWLNVREQRYQKWPILKKETWSEAIEGTATYVTYKYVDLLGYDDFAMNMDNDGRRYTFVQRFDTWMTGPEPTEVDVDGKKLNKMNALERSQSYEVGAALGYILDVLLPDWKIQIDQKNKTQFELIQQAIGQ